MYICSNCGYKSITKLGVCPSCGEYGTFIKEENSKTEKKGQKLEANQNTKDKFYDINNKELKRVFTNGIKSNGVYLLAGHPGVGKSTLVLQIIDSVKNLNIAYFTAEEDASAIFSRYKRISSQEPNFKIYHSVKLEDILSTAKEENFDLIIVDSIQTIYSEDVSSVAGSANQVKYCSEKLSEFAKKTNTATIIIGHITKAGEIAGPKYLEHIVDVVAYLEGDRFNNYRFLRTQKNRFGPSDDVAIFEMTSKGLKGVNNFQKELLKNYESLPGTVLTVGIDNGRPVLITLEVLLNKTKYKFPKRTTIGVDNSRLELVIAILERYLGINLGFYDIFVNIPGELKFYDAGLDLALAAGILSAYYNKKLENKVFIGEISLSGKVNKTKFHEKRLKEVKDFDVVDYQKLKDIREIGDIVK